MSRHGSFRQVAGILAFLSIFVFIFIGNTALAGCPSADLTGDCFVDLEDFAEMAKQWLTGDPCVLDDIVYIPAGEFQMGDQQGDGWSNELPIHTVSLDAFFMSKFEITNQQYCDYLNSAYPAQIKFVSGVVYAVDDANNSYPYCDTSIYSSYSQINYSANVFSVRFKDGITDMSNHPMVMVSWFGTTAYCNWKSQQDGLQECYDINDPNWECDFTKNGYRLPTEAEWEYAARGGENSPYYRYPWGDSIDGSMANYWFSGDPYEIGAFPWTTPVGYYDGNQTPAGVDMANGYGLYDMAGNVYEWCYDWYDSDYYSISPTNNPTGPVSSLGPDIHRVLRGGIWSYFDNLCRVASRDDLYPGWRRYGIGFRIVLVP